MLFIVRGKTNNTDSVLRVDADSPEEAEAIGWKRGLFVTEVLCPETDAAEPGNLARMGHAIHRIWRYIPTKPLICFGRPVSSAQSASLIMLGMTTWALQLQTVHFVGF